MNLSKNKFGIIFLFDNEQNECLKYFNLEKFRVVEKFGVRCGIVACPVIQAIGRPDFEDGLRTRSPGEVISD